MKSMKSTIERTDEKEMLKVLSEQAPVGVCIMQDGKFCYVNSKFPIAIGYTVDELIGKDSLEIVVPQDREMVMENTLKMLNGEFLSPYQFRVICRDGSIVWVMATVKSIQYHGRRAILGNYMEVTERKEMEEAMRESEERYRELANSITDVFFAMDEHLRYTYWNQASENLTGIRAEEATGKSLREVFPDTSWRRRAEKVYRSVLKTQQPQTFVNDTDIDGRHYIFEVNAYPSRGGISVFVTDITERRQAEEALKKSEEKYRKIFQEALDAIFVADAESGVLIDCNRAACELVGARRSELIGKHQRILHPPEEIEGGFSRTFHEHLRAKQGKLLETKVITKKGEIKEVACKANVLEFEGKKVLQGIFRDVTERKRAEEALKQSEERYRTILEEMGDGYFETDLAGNLTFVNDAMIRLLGYSGEEMIGMNFRAFTPREKVNTVFEAYNRVYRTGDPLVNFPTEVIRKDGAHIFAETSAFPIRNSGNEIIGFRGIRRDITARKQMEEALRHSEERYRTILEEMEDSYFEVDVAGHLTFVNNSVCRDLGYSTEELIGMSYKNFVAEDDVESLFQVFNEVYRTGVPNKGSPWKTVRKDGTHGFAETSISLLRDNKGEITGFRGVGRDITERKEIEEALQESEKKLRLISENSRDIICLHASDHRYVYVSPACKEILGYEPEELVGTNPWELVHPEDIEGLQKEGQEKALQGMPVLLSYRIRKKSGEYVWFESTSQSLKDDAGNLLGFVTSSRDITGRKQAEEALRQSEERYRTILEEMEDSYFEVDLAGHLAFVNDSVCRDLGYSREELIGMSYKNFVAEDDIESLFRVFNEVYRTGVSNKGFPWKAIHKDGTHGFAETSVSLLRSDDGEIIGFRGVGRDVTQRKQAEETLSKTQSQLASAVEMTHLGPWEYDAINDLFIFNDAFYRIFHTTAEEVGGYTMSSVEYARRFIHPDDAHLVGEEVLKALQANEPNFSRQLDHRIIYADGGVGYMSVRFFIVKDETGSTVMTYGVNQDITERKRMEEALQAEKNKLQSIIDAMQDALTIQDREYNIVFQNEPSRISTGGDRVGEKCYWAYEGNESICKDCPVEESFKDGKSHISQRQRVLPSGEPSFWETISNPIWDASGKIAGCLEIARDITERKKQEQALANELTRRRLLIDRSLDGIVVLGIDARVVEANHRFAEMLGYTLEEVHELHTWDWDKNFPPEKILEMGRNVDEQGFHLETKHTCKDGSVIDVDISINAAMCAGQKLIFCVCRDVTARKKMEEALKLAAEEWSRTFDSISDAVSIHDKDFRILRANNAFAHLFGKTLSEIIGIHCYELHKGKKPRSGCPHHHTLTTGKPAAAEFYESHLGKYLLESTSPIFNEHGEVVGTVHISRDITEQKRQNERLMITDRLASLGELASGTAHELNNPLTSIIGFSQLLMEKEVPDDIREDLKLINNEAQRAASVTRNLLTFARKQAPMKQRNQINNIIEDVLKLRAYEHKANGIKVEKQLAPDLPEVMVDYFQMQQVFLNIIINAEYFMIKEHNEGALTITTQKQDNTVQISFADDGPGISEENLRRIFDPFFTTKEIGKGTGLGLSICHGIVTEHGGQIYARSQPDKGATIFVQLPINGS